VPRLADAIDAAVALAETGGSGSISEGAVLVTGSVVTAGEARLLLGRKPRRPLEPRGTRAEEGTDGE
jgi:dihydrofolate synthase/folylpolyglutamate synthase